MRAGILVESLRPSQITMQLTDELNKLNRLDYYLDIIVFYSTYSSIIKSPHFATMQYEELWGYNAPVIATNLTTAKVLLQATRPTKKFFYIWDLEWTFSTYNYTELYNIYCNPNLELIARSPEHYKIINDCWKRPAYILEEFKYDQLATILTGTCPKI